MDSELPATNLRNRKPRHKKLSDSISVVGSYTIGWAAPNEQVKFLVEHGDSLRWVGFRDGFMSKWTNLNIVVRRLLSHPKLSIFVNLKRNKVRFDHGVSFPQSAHQAFGAKLRCHDDSAISTVMFADVELDRVSFGFGVVSLLSSLISIGFGTGLMYVLGDVDGHTLNVSPSNPHYLK